MGKLRHREKKLSLRKLSSLNLVADPGRQTGSHVPVWALGLSDYLLHGSDYSEHGVFLSGYQSVHAC